MTASSQTERAALSRSIFPNGIPGLWCPPLTHYTAAAALDFDRIHAHLRHMAPVVKTFLLFGSTGDGWELSEEEVRSLLGYVIGIAEELGVRLLIGVLRPDAEVARKVILDTLEYLKAQAGTADQEKALRDTSVCGFTVCAPKGKDLDQKTIRTQLDAILDLGLPTAVYQLPQVTENEISPETFASLVETHPNFYLFKDTSGTDRVILSGADRKGVFMVRGMEGAYADWYPPTAPGRYDGFLLSSANCFAREIRKVMDLAGEGRTEEANLLSGKISRIVMAALGKASEIEFGNAFANSNKAFDHYFAYGGRADKVQPPMCHAKKPLPEEYLRVARDLLEDEDFFPEAGYLER